MSASIDVLNPEKPKKILLIAANPAVSQTTGWPIGFWWAELTHPYWEFVERGYAVEIVSPQGGDLQADSFSDPRDESGYSADDLISLGFISSPKHAALVKNTKGIAEVNSEDYDAIFIAGGQSPMYTMIDDENLHKFVADFYESGKMVAIVCHGTCILLKVKLSDGKLLVDGKTWTGFANSEEEFADSFVGKKIQPFWIEEEAKKIPNTNFIVSSRFKAFAVRDGQLITGQQQFSGAAAAKLLIEALGV
ncbi:MAG: type 1 glutamine amidotransferase domain-containing protein [Microscillaceae bacterium]|nr:type 1 glutamine amidotransferase domain-containing protein [Microscillaceae bacterium]